MATRGGRHMASSRRDSDSSVQRRREPLNDNYYYEQPREPQQGFEDMSSYSSPQKKKADQRELDRQRNQKKGKGRAKKIVLATLVVIALLIGGGCWYVFGYLLGDLTVDTEFKRKDPEALGIVTSVEEGEEPVVLDDSIKNIAMFGVDARGNSFEGLSDVVMILTIDNKHDTIKMTSVLRDSCVILENGNYAKLTEVYAWGGPEAAVSVLNRNYSIGNHPLNITDYVTVNFAKMARIIDAVGGIEMELTGAEVQQINANLFSLYVEVKEKISQDKYNGTFEKITDYAHITADDYMQNIYGYVNQYSEAYEYNDGKYLLNGNQAVAYGRIRKIGNDDMRATRQQNVLKALIGKVKGMKKTEYPAMVKKIMPLCKTSLDVSDILGMVPIIMTDFKIETMNVPGEVESARGGFLPGPRWVYVYDLDCAAMNINVFIYEEDSPYYGMEIYPGIGYIPDVAYTYENEDGEEIEAGEEPEGSDVEIPPDGWEEDPWGGDDPYGGGENGEGGGEDDPYGGGENGEGGDTGDWGDSGDIGGGDVEPGGDEGWDEGAANGDVTN